MFKVIYSVIDCLGFYYEVLEGVVVININEFVIYEYGYYEWE